MHRWHHALELRDRNFSTKLAIWDFLFGAACRPHDRKPEGYGLSEPFPSAYVSQVLWAFRRAERVPVGSEESLTHAAPRTDHLRL